MTAPNVNNYRKSLKKRLPEHLKLIRNHDFRHSHAAFLISQGLRKGEGKDYIFFTLMKRLGHSSINNKCILTFIPNSTKRGSFCL